MSYDDFKKRQARIAVVEAFGESEGSEWGEIISALACACDRMNGMCADEDVETILKIAEKDIEAFKQQIEPDILYDDEYAVDTFNYVNGILADNELPAWTIEGYDPEANAGPCKTHPRYKAVHKPRVACEPCWSYYFAQHPESQVANAN